MHNELFTIGPFTFYGYGLMLALGIITSILVTDHQAKKTGMNSDDVWGMFLWVLILGVVGCKVLFWIVNIKDIINDPSILLDISNGFVIYGGIIFGLSTLVLYTKKKNMDTALVLDMFLPTVSLAQGIGRIGCFLAGCCYGKPTDLPIGITFTSSGYAPNGISLYPTQLMMSAGDFVIAAILFRYAKNNKFKGSVGTLYLILYGTGRFLIEFFRGDPRGTVGPLSTSQFISVIFVIIGLMSYYLVKKKMSGTVPDEPVVSDKK